MLKNKCNPCHFACTCREEKFIRLFEELQYHRARGKLYDKLKSTCEDLVEEINATPVGRDVMDDRDIAYALRQWENSVQELEKHSENN